MKNLCQIKKEFLNSQDIKTFTNQQSANAKIKYKQLVYLIAWKVWKATKPLVMMGRQEFDETFWDELKIEALHEY